MPLLLSESNTMRRRATERENFSATFPKDLFASIVVFLVALPLCMGIAIACNLPPSLGLATGIIGGLVVGGLSGSQMQVSGPAAGLVVIVCELIREQGLAKFSLIVAVAGLIQIAAGMMKTAQWFRAVPPSVVNGMLSGIGVLLFASQFHVMVDDLPKGNGLQNLMTIPQAIAKGLFEDSNPLLNHHIAAPLGVLTICIIIAWERFAPKRFKIIPASLLAVLCATIISAILHLPIKHVVLPQTLVADLSFLPDVFNMDWLEDAAVYTSALELAFVATAETLLTATALDKMHKGERTNYDRELCAQGVGNLLCGFVGSLPMTGVLVRSGANVSAGAKTRLSAIMHGAWLLLFVSCLPMIIRLIPNCSLAALLVYTGYKLANFKVCKQLLSYGKSEVLIYCATVVCIVCVDLLSGVLLGIGLAVLKLVYIFAHLDISIKDDEVHNRTELKLTGAATFLNLPRIAGALESINPRAELHVNLTDLSYVDHACIELLNNWDKHAKSTGSKLVIDWASLGVVDNEKSPAVASPLEAPSRRT